MDGADRQRLDDRLQPRLAVAQRLLGAPPPGHVAHEGADGRRPAGQRRRHARQAPEHAPCAAVRQADVDLDVADLAIGEHGAQHLQHALALGGADHARQVAAQQVLARHQQQLGPRGPDVQVAAVGIEFEDQIVERSEQRTEPCVPGRRQPFSQPPDAAEQCEDRRQRRECRRQHEQRAGYARQHQPRQCGDEPRHVEAPPGAIRRNQGRQQQGRGLRTEQHHGQQARQQRQQPRSPAGGGLETGIGTGHRLHTERRGIGSGRRAQAGAVRQTCIRSAAAQAAPSGYGRPVEGRRQAADN